MIIRKKPRFEEISNCGPHTYEMAEWNQDIQSFDRIILNMVEVNQNICVPRLLPPACRPYNSFITSSFQKDYSYIKVKRDCDFTLNPTSTLWDVENHDGSDPIRIGNVKLNWHPCELNVQIFTPELEKPKFVIRANRFNVGNCCPLHFGPC